MPQEVGPSDEGGASFQTENLRSRSEIHDSKFHAVDQQLGDARDRIKMSQRAESDSPNRLIVPKE
jgi:hypothetical protein